MVDEGATTINEQWSNAHLAVTSKMTDLLNTLRNLGYNPSHHISYDRINQHLTLDEALVSKHTQVATAYQLYLSACAERQHQLDKVQELPKLDIGFSAES